MRGAPGLRSPDACERARGGSLRASRHGRPQPVESFCGCDLRCRIVPERSRQRHAGRGRRTGAAQRGLEIAGRVVLPLYRVRPAASAGRPHRGGGYSWKQLRRRAQDGRVVRECACGCQDGGRRDDGEDRARNARSQPRACGEAGTCSRNESTAALNASGYSHRHPWPPATSPRSTAAARRAGGGRASGR